MTDDEARDNPTMTDLDLAPIKARLAAATPGPWTWVCHSTAGVSEWTVFDAADHALATNRHGWRPDAEFIAHAPTDIAALLAEVERLRAELADEYHTMDELTAFEVEGQSE